MIGFYPETLLSPTPIHNGNPPTGAFPLLHGSALLSGKPCVYLWLKKNGIPLHHVSYGVQKQLAVLIIAENLFSFIPQGQDMIKPTFIFYSPGSALAYGICRVDRFLQ